MKGVMPKSRLNEAERRVQHGFSLAGVVGATLIVAIIGLLMMDWDEAPDRYAMAPATVTLHAEPIALAPDRVAPLRLIGAWRLTAPDPRFGGLSALAIDGRDLVALSDSSVLFRFSPPGAGPATVAASELPGGPGSARLKRDRDSESLARDPYGRGWWVGFETNNQLWLYDTSFHRAIGHIDFGRNRWPRNLGLEAMLVERAGTTLVPELAHEVVTLGAGRARREPLTGMRRNISDMVRLPDGEVLVLLREFGLTGFRTALGALVRDKDGWRVERRVPLDVGLFMNLEGIAGQPLGDGRTRLWLVTDDNFRTPMTTALFALDVPAGRWRGR